MAGPLEATIQAYHIHITEGRIIPFRVTDCIYLPDYRPNGKEGSGLLISMQRLNVLPFGLGTELRGEYGSRQAGSLIWEASLIVEGRKDPRYNQSQPFDMPAAEAASIEEQVALINTFGTYRRFLPRRFGSGFPSQPTTDELREKLAHLRRH
jgi:hypothetical protein